VLLLRVVVARRLPALWAVRHHNLFPSFQLPPLWHLVQWTLRHFHHQPAPSPGLLPKLLLRRRGQCARLPYLIVPVVGFRLPPRLLASARSPLRVRVRAIPMPVATPPPRPWWAGEMRSELRCGLPASGSAGTTPLMASVASLPGVQGSGSEEIRQNKENKKLEWRWRGVRFKVGFFVGFKSPIFLLHTLHPHLYVALFFGLFILVFGPSRLWWHTFYPGLLSDCPRETARCKSPFALRTGISQEDRIRTKEITQEGTNRNCDREERTEGKRARPLLLLICGCHPGGRGRTLVAPLWLLGRRPPIVFPLPTLPAIPF